MDVKFTVQKGEEFLTNQTAGIELAKDDIIITPVPRYSKRWYERTYHWNTTNYYRTYYG